MQNSTDSGFNEIKQMKGRRGIRDKSEEMNLVHNNRVKINNIEDRSNSEPPRSFGTYHSSALHRLKPIREKNSEDAQSSDEDELSKSNSQLNESDLDMEIPDSASASVSQTPTPTPLVASSARRINSETNLNETKRRLSGFMGNRSKRFCASNLELSFNSHLDTNKSLFSPKNNALSRQSFNSSLYGSNMSLNSTNSRLFMVNSPFYTGKTMFGGASAYPKRDFNQHKILRTPIQMRPSSSQSNSSNTSAKSDNIVPESNAAKRILEIMNQFSGPLKETRSMGNNINSIIKIPALVQSRKRYGEEELSFDRSIALSTPSAPYSRPLSGASCKERSELPINSLITKPLQIPTMSQLLQMKRLQNNTEKVREIASRSDSFLNRNQEYKLPSIVDDGHSNASGSASLKMKSNISKTLLRNDRHSINDQLPALPVNLPNIQMPLKSIPKFDIQMSSPVPNKASPAPSQAAKTTKIVTVMPEVQFNYQPTKTPSLKETTRTVRNEDQFIFSKPISICDATFETSSLKIISEKFTLSKPELINHEKDILFVAKSPLKTTLSTPATDSLFKSLAAQQSSTSWECESCLTRNKVATNKCLCCETPKPGCVTKSPVETAMETSPLAPKSDDLFKNLAAQQKKTQWECESCCVSNDPNVDECACCGEVKPGSNKPKPSAALSSFTFGMPATSNSTPAPVKDDLFKTLAAQQKKSQWECDACLTRNDAGKDTCACCETKRAGATSSQTDSSFNLKPSTQSSFSTQSSVKPTFSFGMPQATSTVSGATADSGFKKLVEKQNASWECSACMTRNEPAKTKCVCCEQAKPGTGSATPQFSFGSKQATVSLPAASEIKFSFGIPPAQNDKQTESLIAPVTRTDEVDKPKEAAKPAEINATVSLPTFSFKANNETPIIAEKNGEKEPVVKAALPMFGMSKPEQGLPKKTTFETKAPEPVAFIETPKSEEVKKPVFGGFKFGETSAPVEKPFENSLNKNGGFSFGNLGTQSSQAKTEEVKTAPATLPAAMGGFQFGASSNAFNSPTLKTTVAPAAPANAFVFGQAKTDSEPTKTFGSGNLSFSSTSSSNAFAITEQQSAPTFGTQNTSAGGFNFTAKSDPAPPQQPSLFAFAAKSAEPTGSSPMLFGKSNQTNQAPSVTPVFGMGSTTFGSTASINNNNESGFGSKMPLFGNSQPQKRAFEFTSNAAPEVPQAKKFDFGAQQQQQQQATVAPFQFNAQGNENKPSFNFSANSSANFSFSNPIGNNSQDLHMPYQFGANHSNPSQGNFSFAPSSAPVMQFGSGAAAPSIAIPGITSFSAQGTGSAAAANQRKILRANRRTTRR